MPSAEHRLGLRTLFIIPSRFGVLWLGAALLLLLVLWQWRVARRYRREAERNATHWPELNRRLVELEDLLTMID